VRTRQAIRLGGVRASLLVVAATAGGSIASFLLQAIAARQLDPDGFSLFAALLALLAIALLPGPPISLAIVRHLGDAPGTPPRFAPRAARTAAIVAGLSLLGAALLGTLLPPGGVDRLHLGDRPMLPMWGALIAAVVAGLWIQPSLARLQAAGEFARYGAAQAGLSVGRLGLAGGALALDAPLGVVLLALAAGPLLVQRCIRPRPVPGSRELTAKERGGSTLAWLRRLLPLLAALGGLQALVLLDVVFARAHFGESDPQQAGAYAASATLARALFHLPYAVTAVLVQRTVHAPGAGAARRGAQRKALLESLLVTSGLVGIGAAILAIAPTTALEIFGGEERYAEGARWLVGLLVPMGLAAIGAVPAHSLLARGSSTPVWILGISAPLLAVLLAIPPEAPDALIARSSAVIGAATAAMLLCAWWMPRESESVSSPA